MGLKNYKPYFIQEKIDNRLLIFGLSIILSLVFLNVLIGPGINVDPAKLTHDSLIYMRMSGLNFDIRLSELGYSEVGFPYKYSPYKYRILTPLLVKMIPINPWIGFQIVTLVCLALFIFLFTYILYLLGFVWDVSVGGILIFMSLFYPIIYSIKNPFLVDPLFYIFCALAIILILKKRPILLTLVLAVGVLNNESILFITPFCFAVWFDNSRKVKSFILPLLVVLPSLFIYLRFSQFYGFKGYNSSSTLTLEDVVKTAIYIVQEPGYLRRIASGLLLSGSILWLYVAVGWNSCPDRLRRLLIGGAASFFPLLILAGDIGRQLAKFVPFWLPCFLQVISRYYMPPRVLFIVMEIVLANCLLAAATLIPLPFFLKVLFKAIAILLLLIPIIPICHKRLRGCFRLNHKCQVA